MYYKNYPHLFSEGKIGKIAIKNRIVMSPMGMATDTDGTFNNELIEFYALRAKGGVGMIVISCVNVQRDIDPFPIGLPAPLLDHPNKIAKLRELCDVLKSYGTVPCLQITAGFGRVADKPQMYQPVSSSPCPCAFDPSVICRELTVVEIKDMVKRFARAAEFAAAAGVQVLEIHGHAGYLLDQFLSPTINKRTDEYGGSMENRFRILKEICEAIKEKVGDRVAVTLRFSVDDKAPGLKTLQEDGLAICKLAEAAGYDGLNVDSGALSVPTAMQWLWPTSYMPKGCMMDLAKAAKGVVKIPVINAGSYDYPDVAEKALETGATDFIGVARCLLADPEWAEKVRTGRLDEIRPCVKCNEMCVGMVLQDAQPCCSVNPECARETRKKVIRTDEPKRVTVVGGGPAGLETAVIAAQRGHTVTILEKANELGGLLNIANAETFKYVLTNWMNYMKKQVYLKKVNVKLGVEATVDTIKATNPDVVVLATGSDVYIPNIPGFDSDKVMTVRGLIKKKRDGAIGNEKQFVVVGGGMTGCEAALGLAMEGHKATILEMMNGIAGDMFIANKFSLMQQLEKYKVTVLTGAKCKCIDDGKVVFTDCEGKEQSLPFDYVIAATGTKSINAIIKDVEENFPNVYVIGDCVKPAKVGDAVHQAYTVANRI